MTEADTAHAPPVYAAGRGRLVTANAGTRLDRHPPSGFWPRSPARLSPTIRRYREVDLAIDFCEDVVRAVRGDAIDRIKAIFEEEGAVAKISSIHVNGWFGDL